MHWYVPRDKFDDKLMKELENQLKNCTLDELMDVLEEMATMHSKEDKSESHIDDDESVTDDSSDCDGDCEHCEFNEKQPIEFDITVHDPSIDPFIDYLDDKSEDEYDAHDQNEYDDQGEHDAVNHPSYYCGNIEVIDFIEDKNLGYHLGNAVKYISRAGKKHEEGMSDTDKMIEDLRKAVWYINRKIEILENM